MASSTIPFAWERWRKGDCPPWLQGLSPFRHCFLELQGGPKAEALDSAARGRGRHGALAANVIGLELDVRVPVPVQAHRVFAIVAAQDVIVVQVDEAVAVGDLPGAE